MMMKAFTDRRVLLSHALPFAVWLAVILLLQALEAAGSCPRAFYPWSYAVKTGICAGLFFWLKPWRVYDPLRARHVPLAVALGALVAAVWILPETPAFGRLAPGLQLFYHRWLIMMPGSLPSYFNPDFFPSLPSGHLSLAYAPEEAGWALTLAKLAGSACVIAVLEEFFFRGFFYRWLRKDTFWTLPLNVYDAQAFWVTAGVFALEHDRWLAGLLAGAVYGWLSVRTGSVWAAALAHGVTNLLLGLYVIVSKQYGFW